MTASVTADFRDAYIAEHTALLRRRFILYAAIVIGLLGLLVLVEAGVLIFASSELRLGAALDAGVDGAVIVAYAVALAMVRAQRVARDRIIRIVYWLLVGWGVLTLTNLLIFTAATGEDRLTRGIGGLLLAHLLASLFLSWTPREAARPMVPLLILNALLILFFSHLTMGAKIGVIAASPLIAAPGVLIAWWRASSFRQRFQFRMLKGHYGQMKREFGQARQIHESLFPAPVRDGPVRLEFTYDPASQIGGDFLFARLARLDGRQQPILNVVVLDVTGHGLSAALTVNRLAGEIERELGEAPDKAPADLLTGLNDYIHHTLARHAVFATALCMRVDPNRDIIEWANAGHPPAFVRTVGGTLERLDPTTILLGACHGDAFPRVQRDMPFGAGDAVLAYTDGASEATCAEGRMLGIAGLQRLVATIRPDDDGRRLGALRTGVERHRDGPARDDTLLVEVRRPLESQTAARARDAAKRAAAEVKSS